MSLASKESFITREIEFLQVRDVDQAASLMEIFEDGGYQQIALGLEADTTTYETVVLVAAVSQTRALDENILYRITVNLAQKVGLMLANNRMVNFMITSGVPRMSKEQKNHLLAIMSGFKEPINVSEVGGLIGVLHDPIAAAEQSQAADTPSL